MAEIMDGTTIGAAFAATVSAHADKPFLAVPANESRAYLPSGFEIRWRTVDGQFLPSGVSALAAP